MTQIEGLVGESTQITWGPRSQTHGAFHATWNNPEPRADRQPCPNPRPKKRGGCKTCDGRGCVGRCKF